MYVKIYIFGHTHTRPTYIVQNIHTLIKLIKTYNNKINVHKA